MSEKKRSLTRLEQETVILFNEEEGTATIQTYNGKMKRRLAELSAKHPDRAIHLRTDEYGGEYYAIPKKLVRIGTIATYTDEQRQTMSDRLRRAVTNGDDE